VSLNRMRKNENKTREIHCWIPRIQCSLMIFTRACMQVSVYPFKANQLTVIFLFFLSFRS